MRKLVVQVLLLAAVSSTAAALAQDESKAAAPRPQAEPAAAPDAAGPRYQGKSVGQWLDALEGPERIRAMGALMRSDASAVPLLAELLRSDRSHVRTVAATALAQVAPPPATALPELTAALKDHNLNVRY